MHTQRVVLLAVAALGLLSAFLPWFTIMIIGVSGMDLDRGWVVLVLFGIAIAGVITDKRHAPIGRPLAGMLAVVGIAAAGFGISKAVLIKRGNVELVGELGEVGRIGDARLDGLFGGMFDLGYGLYLLIAAGALLAIIPLVRRAPRARPDHFCATSPSR